MLKKCINLFRNIYVEGDIENNIDSSYTIDIDKYNELNVHISVYLDTQNGNTWTPR
jgi:hypothetical protein